MCHLSVINLHHETLNKKMLLLMQTLGSATQKDGWGFSSVNGVYEKSEFPVEYTTDYGNILRSLKSKSEMLLGHIRQASPNIPVCDENSHPFVDEDIVFMHNGKLTPKDPKKFVTEYEKKVKEKAKDGTITEIVKKFNISDSLIFFNHATSIYKEDKKSGIISAIKKAMDDFTGKFAILIRDIKEQKTYIFKGKTADLHISYMSFDCKVWKTVGFVVGTNRDVLDRSAVMLSNLMELDGHSPLYFSVPKRLEDEKIYVVEEFDIKEIDEIKENSVSTITYSATDSFYRGEEWGGWNGDSATKKTSGEKLVDSIQNFCREYCISENHLQNIMYYLYGVSLLEVDEELLRHFCKKIIPTFASSTTKTYRKRLKKALGYSSIIYSSYKNQTEFRLSFPWMLSSKTDQNKFIAFVEEEAKNSIKN